MKKIRGKEIYMKIRKALACSVAAVYAGCYFPVTKIMAKGAGVTEVTNGIETLKNLVLACVGGVGVIFLAWGLLDFGSAYSDRNTSEQSMAIKKVIGGLIMIAVPSIIALLT